MNQSTKIEAKGLRATTLDSKVGRAITKGGAIEKSPILLSQYWINEELNHWYKNNLLNVSMYKYAGYC